MGLLHKQKSPKVQMRFLNKSIRDLGKIAQKVIQNHETINGGQLNK